MMAKKKNTESSVVTRINSMEEVVGALQAVFQRRNRKARRFHVSKARGKPRGVSLL